MEYVRYVRGHRIGASSPNRSPHRMVQDPETPTRNPAASSSRQQGQQQSSTRGYDRNPPVTPEALAIRTRHPHQPPPERLPQKSGLSGFFSSKSKEKEGAECGRQQARPPASSQQPEYRSPSRSLEVTGTTGTDPKRDRSRGSTPPKAEAQKPQKPLGPRGAETGFLKMRCYGPFHIDDYGAMRELCPAIVGLTLEAMNA